MTAKASPASGSTNQIHCTIRILNVYSFVSNL